MVPEKQGLKLRSLSISARPGSSLSSGSRKTRIETLTIKEVEQAIEGLSSGSRKTRIETRETISRRLTMIQSEQWFQKNKD